jgi:hypothetical protein
MIKVTVNKGLGVYFWREALEAFEQRRDVAPDAGKGAAQRAIIDQHAQTGCAPLLRRVRGPVRRFCPCVVTQEQSG